MPRALRRTPNYSSDELRRMLLDGQRRTRLARLEQFRRTGRIMRLDPLPRQKAVTGAGIAPRPTAADEAPVRRTRPAWTDRALLIVEVLAVLGLLFVVFNGVSLMRSLNREVTAALQQPSLAPTPLVMAVVLPSGHTPPNAPGGVQPNDAEIPEHLRPLVQSLANLPIPTPGPEQAVRIQIPAINLDAPVVQGDGWEQLKKGVGQSIGSANPGSPGNVVLSAHNDVFGEIFRDLDRLKSGDIIILFTSQRTFTYIVQQVQVVQPTQVELMAQTRESVVTLISCYPYLVDDHRIVVTAFLQE